MRDEAEATTRLDERRSGGDDSVGEDEAEANVLGVEEDS